MQARAEIRAQRALREYNTAEFYYKTKHYGSAKIYYASVIRDYPDTRLAQESSDKIDSCKGLPDVPTPTFQWLVDILPASKKEGPVIATAPTTTTTR